MSDSKVQIHKPFDIDKKDFGEDFKWGVSTAACQTEGAYNVDGKGASIWDVFSHKKGNVASNHNPNTACDFYHQYKNDVHLMQSLHIPNFRFSFAWSRILPEGTGSINQRGIDFYK